MQYNKQLLNENEDAWADISDEYQSIAYEMNMSPAEVIDYMRATQQEYWFTPSFLQRIERELYVNFDETGFEAPSATLSGRLKNMIYINVWNDDQSITLRYQDGGEDDFHYNGEEDLYNILRDFSALKGGVNR